MVDVNQVAATIESLPAVLAALLAPFDAETLGTRPEPGEWAPLEVLGHLIDSDSGGFRDRIGAIVAGNPDIASFDEWEAINKRDFRSVPLDQLLDELAAQRRTSVDFLRNLTATDLSLSATFHDGRRFEANDFVYEWPFHDHDHVQQILAALKLTYLPHMTSTMRDALTS